MMYINWKRGFNWLVVKSPTPPLLFWFPLCIFINRKGIRGSSIVGMSSEEVQSINASCLTLDFYVLFLFWDITVSFVLMLLLFFLLLLGGFDLSFLCYLMLGLPLFLVKVAS